MPERNYDVAVIGGGPGGYTAAVQAGRLGLRTVLFERDRLGGVCLNRGCIPTKSLLKSAEICCSLRHSDLFGVECGTWHVDLASAMRRKDKIVTQLERGVTSLLHGAGVEVIHDDACVVSSSEVSAAGRTYSVGNVILATGSRPFVPREAEGIGKTSDDILALNQLPRSLIVVGGGVIGVEFAYLFACLGCSVTVLEVCNRLLPMADEALSLILMQTLEKLTIQVICGAHVCEWEQDGLTYEKEGKREQLTAEHILIAAGRIPNIHPPELEKLGVHCANGRIITDEQMKTSVEGIYAIGDLVKGPMLAHKAMAEGSVAACTIAGSSKRMRYDRIPHCVYTKPELAWIGIREEQARADQNIVIATYPMTGSGKAHADGRTEGHIKLFADKRNGEVLGAQLACENATDLIGQIAAIMQSEGCVEDLAEMISPHPSICETFSEAARNIFV